MASLFAWKIKNRAKYCQQINNLVGFIIFCRPYVKEQYYTAVFVQYVQRGIFISSRWGKVVDVILNSCTKLHQSISNATLVQVTIPGSLLRISLDERKGELILCMICENVMLKQGSFASGVQSCELRQLTFTGRYWIVKNLIVVEISDSPTDVLITLADYMYQRPSISTVSQ